MDYVNGKYIDCPYDDKDAAKALGARWDPANKAWYVPRGRAIKHFAPWHFPDAHQEHLTFLSVYEDNAAVKQLGATSSEGPHVGGATGFRWRLRPGQNPRPFRRWLQQSVQRFAARLHTHEVARIYDVLVRMDVADALAEAARAPAPPAALAPQAPAPSPQAAPAPRTPQQQHAPARRERSPPRAATREARAAAHAADDFRTGTPIRGNGAALVVVSDDDDVWAADSDADHKPPRGEARAAAVLTPARVAGPALEVSDDDDDEPCKEGSDDCCLVERAGERKAAGPRSGQEGAAVRRGRIEIDCEDASSRPRRRVRLRLFS